VGGKDYKDYEAAENHPESLEIAGYEETDQGLSIQSFLSL
jgi:hypothetical protein